MLKSRRIFPPDGWSFFQPQTNWHAPPGLSFDDVVEQIIRHRLANPRFAANWSVEPAEVAEELDTFTCTRLAMDPNYCAPGVPSPFPAGSPRQASMWVNQSGRGGVVAAGRKIVAGIGVLVDWLGSGGKPVDNKLAVARAETCSGCPKNEPGGLESFFTAPASELIRKQLAIRQDLQLSTPFDEKLNVCSACLCPMKLKVHTPIEHILKHLLADAETELDPRCWIPREKSAQSAPPV